MTIAVLSLPRKMMICVYYSIAAEGGIREWMSDMDPLPAIARHFQIYPHGAPPPNP